MRTEETGPDVPQPRTMTTSGIPIQAIYGPDDVPEELRVASGGPAGSPPYLRAAYPELYRTKPWRLFQLSGFGSPEDMNTRLRFLLEAGETGIIVKQDRMTDDHLYDVDHPEISERREDVGLTGVVTIGLRDYATIMDGIPIEDMYTKPGAGVPQSAPYTLSCFWSVAEQRGIPLERLAGTGQSDFFLTYLGCPTKEQIPPEASMRLSLDIIEWCGQRMPRWVPVSIAGYNAADTGLDAGEELGAVFATAVEYLDRALARGSLDPTTLARSIGGVNFRVSMDIFEEVAKLRIARKMWNDLLLQRYGITDPAARRMRIHVVTAGSAMTYTEPLNNIVRGTVMALAAVLGGTQSLGVSGYDEALSIPSDHAHLMSIRIQQILQEETGLIDVVDPIGGSHYIDALGAALEERAWEFMKEIEDRGGLVASLHDGFLMERAAEHQYETARAETYGARRIVGVNTHVLDDPIMHIDGFPGRDGAKVWEDAMKRLSDLRRTREWRQTSTRLRELKSVLEGEENVVPAMMAALKADATIGEIGTVLREVMGDWKPPFER